MFQHIQNPNPGVAGNAGTLLAASLMQKLVEKGVLSKAEAHDVVQGALKMIEGNELGWAKSSREILQNPILPTFPAE